MDAALRKEVAQLAKGVLAVQGRELALGRGRRVRVEAHRQVIFDVLVRHAARVVSVNHVVRHGKSVRVERGERCLSSKRLAGSVVLWDAGGVEHHVRSLQGHVRAGGSKGGATSAIRRVIDGRVVGLTVVSVDSCVDGEGTNRVLKLEIANDLEYLRTIIIVTLGRSLLKQ
ncbi:hypothetical protein VFPFJ_00188 [Purpureocillium lilacinum]|uniref:Uncharacterized protein n=1 Tax=Purpureocillium lilacinum TaxID=33203 RepID=A0A179HXI5_PURLI|nr:hypothetical protein VFPFJ_00188 [Purpureocillium lilacinum]OAQ94080.1 hypothetical protein VFPFJ_00188 [Purpureocillium lilacinum]